METPLVSIIMPVYNSSKNLNRAIDSVIKQTYQNWELLITDDCSTDNSVEIAKLAAEKDHRIKVFSLNKNSGAAVARNNSISKAGGDFIAFLDSDDLWIPEKLQIQINFMIENKYPFTCAGYNVLSGSKIISTYIPPEKYTYKEMLFNNCVGTLTAVYNCKELGKIYMPEIRKRQDYALWLKIMRTKSIDLHSAGIVLGSYRHVAGSISSNKVKLLKYQYIVFRKCENFSVFKSVFYVCANVINRLFFKY